MQCRMNEWHNKATIAFYGGWGQNQDDMLHRNWRATKVYKVTIGRIKTWLMAVSEERIGPVIIIYYFRRREGIGKYTGYGPAAYVYAQFLRWL